MAGKIAEQGRAKAVQFIKYVIADLNISFAQTANVVDSGVKIAEKVYRQAINDKSDFLSMKVKPTEEVIDSLLLLTQVPLQVLHDIAMPLPEVLVLLKKRIAIFQSVDEIPDDIGPLSLKLL